MQVPNPATTAGLTADQVRGIGFPSFDPPVVLEERQWASVGTFWEGEAGGAGADMLLLNVGHQWLQTWTQGLCPVDAPTLHRVLLHSPERERHSIPYLVRMVDIADADAARR